VQKSGARIFVNINHQASGTVRCGQQPITRKPWRSAVHARRSLDGRRPPKATPLIRWMPLLYSITAEYFNSLSTTFLSLAR